MSTITFGNTAAPSNISAYMDSVFGISVANYRKELTDNIGATNAFLSELLRGDSYESADGGAWIQEPLVKQQVICISMEESQCLGNRSDRQFYNSFLIT